MNFGPEQFVAFAGGGVTGVVYCAALWSSVRRLVVQRRLMWLLAGAAARVAMVLAALYLITGLRAAETLVALAGFVLIRALVSRSLCCSMTPGASAGRRGGNDYQP